MARKKLQSFSADDAGDSYVPTVKTLKGSDVPDRKSAPETKKGKSKNVEIKSREKPVQQKKDTKKEKIALKKEEVVPKSVKEVKQEKPAAPKPAAERPAEVKKIDNDLQKAKAVAAETDQIIQLVGFKIENEEFGLEIQKVQEINRVSEITRVPRTPEFILGVINLRGKVIPVINMRTRFGFNDKPVDRDSRIIVLELQDRVIGILVDSVTEVIRLESGTIEPPPNFATNIGTDYISGVGKLSDRLIVLLDIDKVFTSEQVDKFAEVDV